MDSQRISELLFPFLGSNAGDSSATRGSHRSKLLSNSQLNSISIYIDILLRWNARMNLTAVRSPDEIVERHFGESLFAARNLFPPSEQPKGGLQLIDVGSGAGFPGIPIKIWAANLHVTLIESNHKKTTFLMEVLRALTLTNIDVVVGRAETFPGKAEVITLRAVEQFAKILPVAARLVMPGGRLALLIGRSQVQAVYAVRGFRWSEPRGIPLSANRVLIIGRKEPW